MKFSASENQFQLLPRKEVKMENGDISQLCGVPNEPVMAAEESYWRAEVLLMAEAQICGFWL